MPWRIVTGDEMRKDELSILFLVGCVILVGMIAQDTNRELQSCQKQVEDITNDK